MSTNSGLTGSHAGMTSDTVGGIPSNTATADPKAVQEASSQTQGTRTGTTPSHGPAVSTHANNVDTVPASASQSGSKSGGGVGSAIKEIAAGVQ
jgi:hypothetical protein